MIKKCISINSVKRDEYCRIYGMLSESSRCAIDRKKNSDDRMLSLCGELLARRCVSELSGADETKVMIVKDDLGKPLVKDIPLYVSISHSGEYAAAVASPSPVGIDIEKIRPVRLGMAAMICTEDEREDIFGSLNIPSDEDIEETEREALSLKLLRLWTLKEAYLKAIGTGLAGGLRSVSFKTVGSDIIGPVGYTFSSEMSPAGYITSVCIKE